MFEALRWRLTVWYVLAFAAVFLAAMFAFYPTMFASRTFGNAVKYWTELAGFGFGAAMFVMAIRAFKYVGGRYQSVLYWIFISAALMSFSYPFGPIGQPNKLWTGAQGGTFHHGIMALSMACFLVTALFLQRLEVYRTAPQ